MSSPFQPIHEPAKTDVSAARLRVILAIAFISALAVRLFCFTGLIGSDDLGYSYMADLLARGRFQPVAHHWTNRLMVILPVSAAYRLFGMQEWSTVLAPLLASAASVPLLMAIGVRLFSLTAGLIAGVLLMTFPVHVRYASVLVPEPVTEFLLLLGAWAYIRSGERARGWLYAAGLFFGLAYMGKEPAIFVGGAFVLYNLVRRRWAAAAWTVAGISTVIAAEISYFAAATSDGLFRLHSLKVHYLDPAVTAANSDLPYRLLKVYPKMMLIPNVHFGVHSACALLFGAAGLAMLKRRRIALLLLLWAAVPWLYLNWGSSNLTRYIAIPAAPRYIGLVYMPLFLAAAVAIHRLGVRRATVWLPLIAVALSGIAMARLTRATGFQTARIAELRGMAAKARAGGASICSSSAVQDHVVKTLGATVVPGGACIDPGRHSYIGLP